MLSFLGHYLLAAVIFVVIDSIWIAGIANKFYKSQMGSLLLDKPKFGPAILFYVIYIWGLIYLVIDPALRVPGWTFVLAHAALLGLTMYATYDLTNLATLKKWPVKVTIVDMIWGTFITSLVSVIAVAILR